MTDREKILEYLRQQVTKYERRYAAARVHGNEPAMDRAAARCRVASDIFDGIYHMDPAP